MANEIEAHEIKIGNCMNRWWITCEPDQPWLEPRIKVIAQLQYTDGSFARPMPAIAHSDGSGLLNAILGSDALEAAIVAFAASEGKRPEEYESSYMDCLIKLHRNAMADRQRHAVAENGSLCFVRFGAIPKNGRSRNYRDGYSEAGVSCYRARRAKTKLYIYLAGTDQASAMMIIGSSQMYVVDGDEVGVGADGEPLLANCTSRKCSLPYEIIALHVDG